MPNLDPASDIVERTREIVAGHAGRLGPLLPILHDVQHAFGHLPEESLRTIADRLNLSRAEVHGVASFYHDFRQAPAGRHVLKICRAEACQASGGEAVAGRAASRLKIGFGETTADGAVTLEAVYCLGLCACGPAAMVDGRVVGRVDDAGLDALLAEVGQ
ncbi:MAG: formate dehydrogenase subunit gamma [Zhengella sp.]|uniref:formate dehydrogenase subunit gamma n=1 Tax=Zhengella sp. TaxID=2282762 RepID=UPI001DA9E435|nr:formate dehydrogenase subunit gamma [Notoacmeibacter sp.]MCC0026152.1 formate dehydrogenase subunit gamma [Brucellaceae bacterium]